MNVDILRIYKTRGKRNKRITVYVGTGQTWAEDRHREELGRVDNDLNLGATDLEISKELNRLTHTLKEQSTLRVVSCSDSAAYQEAKENLKTRPKKSNLFPHWSLETYAKPTIQKIDGANKNGESVKIIVKEGTSWIEKANGELIASTDNTCVRRDWLTLRHIEELANKHGIVLVKEDNPPFGEENRKSGEIPLGTANEKTHKEEKIMGNNRLLTRKIHASEIDSGQVLNKKDLSHLNLLIRHVLEMVGNKELLKVSETGGLMTIVDLDTTATGDKSGAQYVKGMAFVTLANGEAWVLEKPPLTHLPWNTRQTPDNIQSQIHVFLTNWIKANGAAVPGENFGYVGSNNS